MEKFGEWWHGWVLKRWKTAGVISLSEALERAQDNAMDESALEAWDYQQAKIDKLEAEKKELVEALEFYGDRRSWGAFDFVPDDGESFYQGNDGSKDIFIIQAGKKAREVLTKTKNEQPTERE